jgi:hypothetical protein
MLLHFCNTNCKTDPRLSKTAHFSLSYFRRTADKPVCVIIGRLVLPRTALQDPDQNPRRCVQPCRRLPKKTR